MKNKIVTFLTALSLVSGVSVSMMTSAYAVSTDNVSVAAVEKGYELVYVPELSNETTKVVNVVIKGVDESYSWGYNVAYPNDLVTNVAFKQLRTDATGAEISFATNSKVNPDNAAENIYIVSGATLNDFSLGSDPVFAQLTFTTKEDAAFDLRFTRQSILDYDDTDWGASVNLADTKITVPKFTPDVPTVTPITEAGTKVVRHTDGLDTPAEYWVAELNPAGVAFNTIKVVATDKTGNTAEGTKTSKDGGMPVLTGESAISVHVAILNAANEVSKVDVTASYVE